MPAPKSFSVIIVSWNVAEQLKSCLNSIFASKYPNLEVIVIDNASSDHSVSMIKTIFPNVILIANPKNLGFPTAVNLGLARSSGEYLLILNPDTLLPSNFFISCLEFFHLFPRTALMGPKFLAEGSVYTEPSILNTLKIYWTHQLLPKYTPNTSAPVEVNALSGACFVMPRSTFTAIGPFTEKVFMYFEDLDYCRRLRQAKLPIIFNPSITITHLHGQSASQTPLNQYRYFFETLVFPLREFLGFKNRLPATARYHNESAIWYNGWLRQLIITFIIWLSARLALANKPGRNRSSLSDQKPPSSANNQSTPPHSIS
jgi:GT2 family glycosyltransferase